MRRGEQSAWTTAAVALALAGTGPPELLEAAADVLRAGGVDPGDDWGDQAARTNAAAQAAAPLLQTARLLDGATWAEQTDEALLAQGRASAQSAPMFVQMGLPMMAGLPEALSTPGARMLDVGTGVGALAEGFALVLPELAVTGIDVMPRVLDLARRRMANSPVRHRVELRQQDVSALEETDVYDLAWLPAPFLPEAALLAGVGRVVRALKPGGWLMVGHGKTTGDRLDDALDRLKIVAFGGTLVGPGDARALLEGQGLVDVMTAPTPPGAPGVTVGRREARPPTAL
jgi:predicted O-methyltransferase YrrM